MPSGEQDKEPVPGLDVGLEGRQGRLLYTLEVDGEVFEVRRSRSGGTNYDWISGRNEGYGFGTSAGGNLSELHHRVSIRNFLGLIDPATGFITED